MSDTIGHPDTKTWIAACALAKARHPNAKYPQPQDIKDAEIMIAGLRRDIQSERQPPTAPDGLMRVADDLLKKIGTLAKIQNGEIMFDILCLTHIDQALQSAGAQQAAQVEALRDALKYIRKNTVDSTEGYWLPDYCAIALRKSYPQPSTKDDGEVK